ncbi:hypothetical protein I79_016348 [Cricetulus griseus]|uniref:Uncharacterized protein n=1 Tax=Cricetulus griseus TaxID=10029 RepID=G3HZ53_CRIGR|nr:hypothetical protein I79_016348 [Cricetulus griseus]
MFSTFRKLFCFKKESRTPLGFCDGPSSGKGSLSCCDCSTEDRYQHPYDPENKFHEAVCEGRTKVVLRLLSKKKFNVKDKDERKRTTLMYAVKWDSEDIAEILLKKGVDHSLKDAFGWDALQYAMAGKRKV